MNEAPPAFRASPYAGSLVAIAALTASITTLFVIFLSRGAAIRFGADATASDQGSWLLALVIAPLLIAVVSVLLAWLTIRLIRVMTYTRALRAYCDRELRRAGISGARELLPLESASNAAHRSAAPPGTNARNDTGGAVILRLLGLRRVLLLGSEGAGKSITLLGLAWRLSSPLASARAALGLARIPVLLSLPGLATALAAGSQPEDYIAIQFAHFGSRSLAARTPRLLRRGGLTLFCDDYDLLDADGRELVDKTLQAWSETPYERFSLVIACDSDLFDRDLDGLGALAELPVERLTPLPPPYVARMLAASQKRTRTRGAAEVNARVALARPVSVMLTVPAVARALADTFMASQPPAWGYGALLRQQLLIKRDTASTAPQVPEGQLAQQDGSTERDVALVWGALAASLQSTLHSYIPLDPSLLMGECAARWLKEHTPLLPVSFALQPELAFDSSELERGIRAGVQTGVLRRHVDGLGVSFAHPIMRKAAAAYWLDAMDNGLGRLNSSLLSAEWIEPVTLWASARPDAVDIAHRIFRLSQSPESVASRAGFSRGADVAPATLALALAAAIEGAAPLLVMLASGAATDARLYFATQQELRDLLDSAAIMAADAAQRRSLMAALHQIHMRIGPSLHTSMSTLIALEQLDRLARAQLTLALGLIGAPDAIEELLSLASQTDLTIRQAARQGLIYAGAEAIPALRRLASSNDAVTRKRASEALALVTTATPEANDVASAAAISGLRSADARQRQIAVTTLSAIRASEALDALIARLDDTSLEVQIAAVNALGQLGAPTGLAALRKRAHTGAPALRRTIAEALGATVDQESLAPLLSLLTDKDRGVRASAAIALGAQGDQRAAGPLREAAQDADPWVRQAAQAAVRRLTGA